jgi:pimeloyl-ACP methyl ester carboxylesterase
MSKTILFVHGAWVTPSCWDLFKSYCEARGYACQAPAWPYLDRPVAELKRGVDPKFAGLTIQALVDHYARKVEACAEKPVLIGHSFGGLIVQLLLDRGLGRAGVAIDPAPPSGIRPSWTAIKSSRAVLLSWRGWSKLHTMSLADFRETFANGLPEEAVRQAYDTQIVQAPGRIFFQAALGLGNKLDFNNPKRGPLVLIAGEQDRTVTPDMVQAMYLRHKQTPRPVVMLRFPGRSHYLIAEPGWEDVAQDALKWVESF